MAFKSGFVAVIGRPNTGKSTLINILAKEKVSIVTPKPQTTRKIIKAIYTDESSQIIYTDTPGIHIPKTKLGEFMVDTAKESFSASDIILFITAPKRNHQIPEEDKIIAQLLENVKLPKICVINKCDTIDQKTAEKYVNMYTQLTHFDQILAVSAKDEFNTEQLAKLVLELLPEGPMYYDEEIYTDQTLREMASEFIREKLLYYLAEEVPHGTAVEIESFKEREETEMYDIDAVIYCDKESHKGIIIGKKGEKLKKIGTEARKTMEYFFGVKVNLKLWVKVKNDWRNNKKILDSLGYKK